MKAKEFIKEASILGDFNFSYKLPSNFDRRICQYLQQMKKSNVVDSFKKCIYEYDDVGLAYYAGLHGDNWNKKAIDITFEGSSADITCLKDNKLIFETALEKALKPSESGFLVRDMYFFPNDVLDDMPETNEDRLNADIEIAKVVLSDLIQIGERVCLNYSFNESSTENSINDYYRDMLSIKGYKEVKDQTRHGISVNGKDAAEVDILLSKNGKEIAIFEGLKLDCVNQSYISTHIDKAIVNYNSLGTATFIVSYVSTADFEFFWKRYSAYLETYKFPIEVKRKYEELTYPNASTRVASIILSKDGYDFPTYFIALKIS